MTIPTSNSQATAPPPVPEPGWTPVEPFPKGVEADLSFVSGGQSGQRLRVAYFRCGDDRQRLLGRAWFGPETEGPPGHAHGGAVSAVLDEALGAAAWAAGHPVVVGRLEVDFRNMVPLLTDAAFETWIESVDGRKVHTRGRLTGANGLLLAEGRALCVVLATEHIEKLRAARATNRRKAPADQPGR